MYVKLKVHNNVTYIESNDVPKEVYAELRKVVGYLPENSAYMINNVGNGQWDGYITNFCSSGRHCKCYNKKYINLPHVATGLYSIVKNFFITQGFHVNTVDERPVYEKIVGYEMSDTYEQRDYQTRVINKSLNKGRGLISVCTGGGKTSISANLFKQISEFPAVFLVPSIDLLIQTKDSFESFLTKNGLPAKIGMIGDGKMEVEDITICTIQTAVRAMGQAWKKCEGDDECVVEKESPEMKLRYKEIKDLIQSAKAIIVDEVQHASSVTCQCIMDYAQSARWRFGASATCFRDQNDDQMIIAQFSGIIDTVTASELIDLGFLVQPHIFMIECKEGYNRSGGHTYPEVYKEAVVNNAYRNNIITNVANTMYEQGKNTLLLVKNIDHGNMLNEMIPNSVFLSGKDSTKVRKKQLDSIRRNENRLTLATSIMDEGVDCKALNTLILCGQGKSSVRAMQRVGRVIRPGFNLDGSKKTQATVIDFFDHAKFLKNHSKKRVQMYKTEPKFIIENLKID